MAQIDLKEKFPSMTPVKSPPSLFTFNGCGVGLYGKRDADAQTGTYVATWCLCLLFVPILALRAYRVARASNGGWYFIGRHPLSTFAKSWDALLVLVVAGLIGGSAYEAHVSTPAYKAQAKMSQAAKLVDRGHLAQAAKIYQELASTGADQSHNATLAMGELLEVCKTAPLSESAGVFTAAARIAHRDGAVARATWSKRAWISSPSAARATRETRWRCWTPLSR